MAVAEEITAEVYLIQRTARRDHCRISAGEAHYKY